MEAFIVWLESNLNDRDWQPTDLAKKAGLHTASITRILNGTRNPGPDICLAMARALDIPPEEVFRRAGLLPPKPEIDSDVEEAIYLFQRLDPERRRVALQALRAWVENKG